MAEKKQYDSIIDAFLDKREPDWDDLEMADAKKSGEEQLDRTHQYVDTDFEDDIAESASRHTPVWGPKSGTQLYEQRIAEKEAAAPRISAVTANRRMNDYKSKDGDNDSLMNEVTESIEAAYSNANLAENSAAKKEVSDAQIFKYVRDLLNQGTSPAKVAQKLQKLAEIELFNHQSATDYLQRNAGLMGLAYLEPNTYMDKNSPTYDHTASKKTGSFAVVMEKDTKNGQRFATEEEATSAAQELQSRWMGMPSDWRVEPSNDPVNYTFDQASYRSVPLQKTGSSNDCVKQKKAWDNAGIKPQAHSVKQVAACQGCTYFNSDARSKTCNLYHLPVVASAQELTQIVNHLTPGVPEKRKHAALVVLANGEGKRVQNPKVAEQTNVVKAPDAKVRNQNKRAAYQFGDNRESSKRFSSEHVAKMHGKGASLKQIYDWAEEKFGSVDTSFAFRGFVQSLRANAKGRIVVASKDLSFLNSIGIRNAAFEGKEKCASCEFHKKALAPLMEYQDTATESIAPCVNCGANPSEFTYDEHNEVFCTECGEVQPASVEDFVGYQQQGGGKFSSRAGRVEQKFASKTVDAVRGKQAEEKEVVVTAAKVRALHQAGHSIEKIYKGAASKVGSVAAKKAVKDYTEDFKKRPGKLAFVESDRAFLIGKLGFNEVEVRKLQGRVAYQSSVTKRVPDDQNVLSYPGMGKHASGEKKQTDGHALLAEFDLTGSHDMQDIEPLKNDYDVEMGSTFKLGIAIAPDK